jgi:hypothetical protein
MSVRLFSIHVRKLSIENHIRTARAQSDVHFSAEEDAENKHRISDKALRH